MHGLSKFQNCNLLLNISFYLHQRQLMEHLKTHCLKRDVYKFLSSCSICDYASRVKHNTIKHLKLHLKEDKLIEIGALEEISLPTVTPVNPSPIEETETSAYSRMKSLLPEDEEEER